MGIFKKEHEELRKVIRRFVDKELLPNVDKWEEEEFFPNSVFERMGELGLLGLRFPEEYGGQAGDFATTLVLFEELARCGSGGLPLSIAVQSEFVCPVVAKFGTERQKQKYLVPSIQGKKIGCLAITEPGAGSDVAAIRTSAVKTDAGWLLNGSKTFITNGVRADYALVLARTDLSKGYAGFSLFLVDTDTKGYVVGRKLKKVGMKSSDTAELFFEDCKLPAEALLGTEGKGFQQIMWELQGERIIGAVGAIAEAEHALQIGLEYISTRKVFSKTLDKYQAIQHRLAELAMKIEISKVFNYTVAEEFASENYSAKRIAMAKLFACQTQFEVCDYVMQIHGGYGYMDEYPISRLWRDARLHRIGGGTDEIMKEIIAREIINPGK